MLNFRGEKAREFVFESRSVVGKTAKTRERKTFSIQHLRGDFPGVGIV